MIGLSTRKVGETLLSILGRPISAETVSQVAKTLDVAVAAFRRRPLQNRYQVLMLDGVVLARKTGAGALRRPVLVALGLRPDGKKEIIDFRLAASESAVRLRASMIMLAPVAATFSVQTELAVDRADLRRPDQARVRDGHRMQRSLEVFKPERQETV